jgi:hypothetical protein
MTEPISRDEFNERLDAVRDSLSEKISSVKAWGFAALIGGQAVAALLTKMAGGSVTDPAHAAIRVVSHLLS